MSACGECLTSAKGNSDVDISRKESKRYKLNAVCKIANPGMTFIFAYLASVGFSL